MAIMLRSSLRFFYQMLVFCLQYDYFEQSRGNGWKISAWTC